MMRYSNHVLLSVLWCATILAVLGGPEAMAGPPPPPPPTTVRFAPTDARQLTTRPGTYTLVNGGDMVKMVIDLLPGRLPDRKCPDGTKPVLSSPTSPVKKDGARARIAAQDDLDRRRIQAAIASSNAPQAADGYDWGRSAGQMENAGRIFCIPADIKSDEQKFEDMRLALEGAKKAADDAKKMAEDAKKAAETKPEPPPAPIATAPATPPPPVVPAPAPVAVTPPPAAPVAVPAIVVHPPTPKKVERLFGGVFAQATTDTSPSTVGTFGGGARLQFCYLANVDMKIHVCPSFAVSQQTRWYIAGDEALHIKMEGQLNILFGVKNARMRKNGAFLGFGSWGAGTRGFLAGGPFWAMRGGGLAGTFQANLGAFAFQMSAGPGVCQVQARGYYAGVNDHPTAQVCMNAYAGFGGTF